MIQPNLSPCPFCGKPGTLWQHDITEQWQAGCWACGARTIKHSLKQEALRRWNERADATKVLQDQREIIVELLSALMSVYTRRTEIEQCLVWAEWDNVRDILDSTYNSDIMRG